MCEYRSPGEKSSDDLSTACYISLQSVMRYFEPAARQSAGTATTRASELRRHKVLRRRVSLEKDEPSGMNSSGVERGEEINIIKKSRGRC